MTVAELQSRISSAEITDWMAYDTLDVVDQKWTPPAHPERALRYDRVVAALDRAFPPE
jgi:hypothetical protein